MAVRWYLRFGLSYRDLEELLAERGIEVDHVTVYRWVQRFTPLLVDAARPRPTRDRGPLVRRRDLREGRRPVALRVPGGRPARPGHRRVAVATSATPQRPRRFFTRALGTAGADRGDHRQGHARPAGRRRAVPAAFTTPSSTRTTVSKPTMLDSRRGSADARTQTPPLRRRDHPRPRLRRRTFAAATTNSASTSHRRSGWRQHSASSRWPCDLRFVLTRRSPRHAERNRPSVLRVDRRESGRQLPPLPGLRPGRGRPSDPERSSAGLNPTAAAHRPRRLIGPLWTISPPPVAVVSWSTARQPTDGGAQKGRRVDASSCCAGLNARRLAGGPAGTRFAR